MGLTLRPFNGKNYWRKKGYALLDGAATAKRETTMQVVKISGPKQKRRHFWRIKTRPKLSVLKGLSPQTLWKNFKEGYMNLMLRMAAGVGGGSSGSDTVAEMERKRIPKKRLPAGKKYKTMEEFETRLALEIYKALSTSRGLSEV